LSVTAFQLKVPVRTRDPGVAVDQLAPGKYLFELVVTDSAGRDSAPFSTEVVVLVPGTTLGPGPGSIP
jgi:hypothetical protein